MDSLDRYLGVIGVGSVKNRMSPPGKLRYQRRVSRAQKLGRDRGPSPAQRGQPSIAGDRCCKLLFESTEESQATSDDLVGLAHEHPGGVAGHWIDSSEAAWHGDISQIGR